MPLNAERRKSLTTLVPEGFAVTRKWLLQNNFDRHAIDNLVKSEQLKVLSNGVYSRGEILESWEVVIYALQNFSHLDCVVGGLTALELQGLAHYIHLSNKKLIRLYSPIALPKWINQVSADFIFTRHNSKDVLPDLKKKNTESFTTKARWRLNADLIMSIPERAMLEMLLSVPDEISFDHANELMQGATSFSPRIVQVLLEQCTSVKCKRLFLLLAERNRHQWISKVDISKIDLGVGNRMLVKGGTLNKKYRISVPKQWQENNENLF